MSKLEILLVSVIVLIVAGVGFYRFGDRLLPKKQRPSFKSETTQHAAQKEIGENHGASIGNMCVKTMEQALQIATKCQDLYGKQGELARESTAAAISNIRNPTKENQEALNIYRRQSADLDATMSQCSRFFPLAQKTKEITPLLKSGRFDEAKRLCLEIDAAIPAGF